MDLRQPAKHRLAWVTAVILVAGCSQGASPPPAGSPPGAAASLEPTIAAVTPSAVPTTPSAAVASPSATATVGSSSATGASTDTAAGVPVLSWTLGAIPPIYGRDGSWPFAVTTGQSTFVAVGGREFRDTDTPSGGTASAWRSQDGITWDPASPKGLAVGDTIPIDDYPQPGLIDVGWGPPGFVAVGIAFQSFYRVGAIWSSTDGYAWIRADLPGAKHARPAAVTWDGSSFVVVGVSDEKDLPLTAVWRSPDGRSWRRVPDSDAFGIGGYITYPAAILSGGPLDVTTGPDGSVVAVGKTCTGTTSMDQQSTCRPYAIGSDDGTRWERLPAPDRAGVVLVSVAANDTRTIAVAQGPGGDGGPASIVVEDRGDWRLVGLPGVPNLARVVAYRDGFLGVSRAGDVFSVWWSLDGDTWSAVPGVVQPPGVESVAGEVDVVARGDQVVIVARADTADAARAGGYALVGTP